MVLIDISVWFCEDHSRVEPLYLNSWPLLLGSLMGKVYLLLITRFWILALTADKSACNLVAVISALTSKLLLIETFCLTIKFIDNSMLDNEISEVQKSAEPSVVNILPSCPVCGVSVSIPVNWEPSPMNLLAFNSLVTLRLTKETSWAMMLEASKLFLTVRLFCIVASLLTVRLFWILTLLLTSKLVIEISLVHKVSLPSVVNNLLGLPVCVGNESIPTNCEPSPINL